MIGPDSSFAPDLSACSGCLTVPHERSPLQCMLPILLRLGPPCHLLQVDVSNFALSVLVTEKHNQIETFVLGDTQACHTYDLRLARFHLLYEPWAQGPAAVSGVERQSSAREALTEPRSLPPSVSNLRSASGLHGALPRATSSQPGPDTSTGGDAQDTVRPTRVAYPDTHMHARSQGHAWHSTSAQSGLSGLAPRLCRDCRTAQQSRQTVHGPPVTRLAWLAGAHAPHLPPGSA